MEVSAKELGAVLMRAAIEGVVEGDESLHARLQASLLPPDQNRIEYWVELFLLGLLPLDMIAAREYGEKNEEVREYAREYLRQYINDMSPNAFEYAQSPDRWQQFIGDRYQDYATTLQAGGVSSGGDTLFRFGHLGITNLSGKVNPNVEAVAVIAIHFSMNMKHMPEALRTYTVKT